MVQQQGQIKADNKKESRRFFRGNKKDGIIYAILSGKQHKYHIENRIVLQKKLSDFPNALNFMENSEKKHRNRKRERESTDFASA